MEDKIDKKEISRKYEEKWREKRKKYKNARKNKKDRKQNAKPTTLIHSQLFHHVATANPHLLTFLKVITPTRAGARNPITLAILLVTPSKVPARLGARS